MRAFLIFLVCLPTYAFAAGGADRGAPKPTATTTTCQGVTVWDEEKKRCISPKQSSLDTDGLYRAARELAYAGRYLDAQAVLLTIADQTDGRVLTYWGFTHRKLGNADLAKVYYDQALAQNPNNLLARSYLGQSYADAGQSAQAYAQWIEIRDRGGAGTWPEVSLRETLETGQTFNY